MYIYISGVVKLRSCGTQIFIFESLSVFIIFPIVGKKITLSCLRLKLSFDTNKYFL